MSDAVSYDTEALFKQANRVLDLAETYRQDHNCHAAELSEASSQWPGAVGAALEQVRAGWDEQHELTHKQVGTHATWIFEATTKVSDTDDTNRASIDAAGVGL